MYEVTAGMGNTLEGFARKGDAEAWLRSDPPVTHRHSQVEVRNVDRYTAPERWVRGTRGGWKRER